MVCAELSIWVLQLFFRFVPQKKPMTYVLRTCCRARRNCLLLLA